MVPINPPAFRLCSADFHGTLIKENFLLVVTIRDNNGVSTITRKKKLYPNRILRFKTIILYIRHYSQTFFYENESALK